MIRLSILSDISSLYLRPQEIKIVEYHSLT